VPDIFTTRATTVIGGDIAFLSKKEFDGKIVTDEGFLGATGTLCTLTANTGKDMYLARAKIIVHNNLVNQVAFNNVIQLQQNAVVLETAEISVGSGTVGGSSAVVYEFKNIGQKVLASQVIRLECTGLSANADVVGFIKCFEEDTGESPTP